MVLNCLFPWNIFMSLYVLLDTLGLEVEKLSFHLRQALPPLSLSLFLSGSLSKGCESTRWAVLQ